MTPSAHHRLAVRLTRLVAWVVLALCAVGIVAATADALTIRRWHHHWSEVPIVLIVILLAGLCLFLSGYLMESFEELEKPDPVPPLTRP